MKQKIHQKFVKYCGFKYINVNNKVYVGSCPTTEEDINILKKIGITSVLCLQRSDEDCSHYEYPKHWKYMNIPVYDCGYMSLYDNLNAVNFINNRSKCYVHCRNGKGRSRTCVYFYLRMCGHSDEYSLYQSGIKKNNQYIYAKKIFESYKNNQAKPK